MRNNLHNIHRQSAQSNHFQNEDGLFREGLIKEYGMDYYDMLCSLKQIELPKYTNEDYKMFYKKACKIANDLRRSGKLFSKDERIEMRTKINNMLNIYNDISV